MEASPKNTSGTIIHRYSPAVCRSGWKPVLLPVSGILIGTISAVAQASHQIAFKLRIVHVYGFDGLAQAGSIRVSNAYGRKDWLKISAIGRSTLIVAGHVRNFLCDNVWSISKPASKIFQ
jgi:MATE family multidrug resistance protein